jgi:hypothetical protein
MSSSKFLTLDANVFVAALKADEPYDAGSRKPMISVMG